MLQAPQQATESPSSARPSGATLQKVQETSSDAQEAQQPSPAHGPAENAALAGEEPQAQWWAEHLRLEPITYNGADFTCDLFNSLAQS